MSQAEQWLMFESLCGFTLLWIVQSVFEKRPGYRHSLTALYFADQRINNTSKLEMLYLRLWQRQLLSSLRSLWGKTASDRIEKWLIIIQKKFAAKICHIFGARIQSRKRSLESICFLKGFDTGKMSEPCQGVLISFCLSIIR